MSFADSLRPASYKGVPFGVIDAQDGRGRNTVTHEFPLRDKIFVEDMGRAKRTIALTGFVIGPGYEARRDALIAVLEQPGPGTLVHPWLGTFQVSLTGPVNIVHSAEDGGYVTFQLQFAEDSVAEAPGPSLDWPFISSANRLVALVDACLSLDLAYILSPIFDEALSKGLSWAQGLSSTLGKIYSVGVKFVSIAENVAGFITQVKKFGSLSALVKSFWPERDYSILGGERARLEAVGLLERALSITPTQIPDDLGTVRRQMAVNNLAIFLTG